MKRPEFNPHLNKEGYLIVAVSALITCIMFAFAIEIGIPCLFLTGLIVYFFRDPVRIIPLDDRIILSPADGVIYSITEVVPPASMGIEDKMKRISIFLSPLNVHVNRMPAKGVIKKMNYMVGKFIRADSFVSEDANERQEIRIETSTGMDMVVIQQAGFIARRIVCDLIEGQAVDAGVRFGIIKFGSRTDIYFPLECMVLVHERQTVVGGETILATTASELKVIEKTKLE